MKTFKIEKEAIDYLSKKDKKLAKLIKSVGPIKREIDKNPFESLVGSIVSQQISTKAASSIYGKLEKKIIKINPENILKESLENLRSCGLSGRKVEYIVGIAKAVKEKSLDFNKLKKLNDEEIIKELIKLKGIGVWSAEMFLIFALERKDVFSFLDLGIRRGLARLYDLKEIDKAEFLKYKEKFSPYGSTASLYLWHLASD